MLDLRAVDLDALVVALADQSALDHTWMVDPRSGAVVPRSADEGIDGDPVDRDGLHLLPVEAIASAAWHRDLADFADRISDQRVAGRLQDSLRGRGAFRRFAGVLERYPTHHTACASFREARGRRCAGQYLAEHPDPVLP